MTIPDQAVPRPLRNLRECDDCGLMLRLPRPVPWSDARCTRCHATLRCYRGDPLVLPLALSLAGLLLYAVALVLPFIEVNVLGATRVSLIESGVTAFYSDGLWELAAATGATLVLLPLVKFALVFIVLTGARSRSPSPLLARAFRWYEAISPWAMLEVFLFGGLIAYTKLADIAHVELCVASYMLAVLVLINVTLDWALDPLSVWELLETRGATVRRKASRPAGRGSVRRLGCDCCHLVSAARPGDVCPRCGARLKIRKPGSLSRTWALLLAAATFYVPANIYPVMNITTFGSGGPHTILGGARELLESGMWPLALIVFLASVAVPVVKLGALSIMLLSIHRRAAGHLTDRTRLYRFVDMIGRWSMIDIFMVSVMVALIQFGALANITSDIGGVCFASVVILTMFAAAAFDPRLMWDAVLKGRQHG